MNTPVINLKMATYQMEEALVNRLVLLLSAQMNLDIDAD